MRAFDRLYLIAAAIFVAMIAGAIYRAHVRSDVLRQAAYEGAAKSATLWHVRADSIKNAQKLATETLTVRVTRWRDQVTRVDTAFLHDTVPVPVEVVREVVRTADSAVTACERVVGICEQRAIALDSVAAALRTQLQNAPRPTPAWRRWIERAALVAATAYLVRGTP